MDDMTFDPESPNKHLEDRYREDQLAAEQLQRPPQPTAEFEALQQMLAEAYNREMILRAEIVRLRRIVPGG